MKGNNYTFYVEFAGGLGNQLFQYAFARALQIRYGGKVVYITRSYDEDRLRICSIKNLATDPSWEEDRTMDFWGTHPGRLWIYYRMNTVERILNRIFRVDPIDDKVTSIYRFKQSVLYRFGIYTQTDHRYNDLKVCKRPSVKYIQGLWHNPKYFLDIKDTLREEFKLKDESLIPADYKDKICNSDSVCVHIRRGDYLDYSYYHVCDSYYFRSAVDYIKGIRPGAEFFIFSDDIGWAKENITGDHIHYVEEMHDDYIDFTLMRMCKHFIISNSTFSWWAAFLGNDPSKIVICPDRWYSDGRNKKQLNLDGWVEQPTEPGGNG